MASATSLIVGFVTGLLVGILFRRSWLTRWFGSAAGAKSRRPPQQGAKSPQGKHRGVSIRPGRQSCAAAQQLKDKRFLAGEAPALPLAGCDREKCDCRYAHHEDRREGIDRRDLFTTFGGFRPESGAEKRRPKSDRRKT